MSDTPTTQPAPVGFADRVAARAVDVRIVKLLLSLIALPFWLLGMVAAVVWLAVRWCYAAVIVGFTDVTNRGADAG